jgi:hypothetical protein
VVVIEPVRRGTHGSSGRAFHFRPHPSTNQGRTLLSRLVRPVYPQHYRLTYIGSALATTVTLLFKPFES